MTKQSWRKKRIRAWAQRNNIGQTVVTILAIGSLFLILRGHR